MRGFPHEYASTELVMIDGRSINETSQAGVRWEDAPVQLQDIERIEIIRGPNTALYGTGAGSGVINIITKKPEEKPSAEIDNRGGTLGMVQSYQAVDGSVGKMAMRVSHTFQQQDGFPVASYHTGDIADFLHKNVANVRASMPLSESSTLDVLSGGSWENRGIDDATLSPRGDFSQNFQTLKLSHQFSRDAAVEATSSRSDTSSVQPTGILFGDRRQLQYDAELLHRFAWADGRLNTTYGTSYRHVQLDIPTVYGSLNARPYLEIYRGYLQQTAKLTDSMTMQGAAALENSSGVGTEPSYQIASIYAPAPEHAFRASYSLAYTHRDLLPAFGDMTLAGGIHLIGDPALNSTPYKFKSYQTGYYGTYFDKRLQTDVSLYYATIDNQHHITALPPTYTTIQFVNYDDSITRGAELSLKYHFSRSQWVYANYTYEHITDIAGDRSLETDNTPAHKFNIGGATSLGHGLSASVDVGYKDAYFITAESGPGPLAAPAYWRLDARLGYVWPWYKNAELYVAGQNLAVSRHQEFPDGLDVPRTYQGGVTVKFGGKS